MSANILAASASIGTPKLNTTAAEAASPHLPLQPNCPDFVSGSSQIFSPETWGKSLIPPLPTLTILKFSASLGSTVSFPFALD